jgi:hypothetical protein
MAMKPKPTMKTLKALVPCCFVAVLLLNVQFISGQTAAPDSTVHKTYWYHAIRLRFPEFILDYVHPYRERSFAGLPNGLDKFMYPTHNEGGYFAPFGDNYRFRWIGLFYKDRIGLEMYTGGYGANVDINPYEEYLKAKFSGYYKKDYYYSSGRQQFAGIQYGLAYKHHWKGLVIEPKFILGFEKLRSDNASTWFFKEMGSNQFTEYEVKYWDSSHNNRSYHFQLRLAKRFKTSGKEYPVWLEFGLKTEYIMAARKELYLQVTERPYGKPEIVEGVPVPMRYRSIAFGMFFTVYLKNGHIIN